MYMHIYGKNIALSAIKIEDKLGNALLMQLYLYRNNDSEAKIHICLSKQRFTRQNLRFVGIVENCLVRKKSRRRTSRTAYAW